MAIWYPEQDFTHPTPYAWTIQQEAGMSVGLENITANNAWQGIQTGPKGNQLLTLKNLFIPPCAPVFSGIQCMTAKNCRRSG